MKTVQMIHRVCYPQQYQFSSVTKSFDELNVLLSKGFKVKSICKNENYFADYVLEKEVEDDER